MSERKDSQERARILRSSWVLFIMLALTTLLAMYSLASVLREDVSAPTPKPTSFTVPAVLKDDRHDYLANGNLVVSGSGEDGAAPEAWHFFTITGTESHLVYGTGATGLGLACPSLPCVAGIWQQIAYAPAGSFDLIAEVYATGGTGEAMRIGVDLTGATDPVAESVLWRFVPAGNGWGSASFSFEHGGGPLSVFIVFDKLVEDREAKVASLHLFGPTPLAALAADSVIEPVERAMNVEVRALLVPVQDWKGQGPEKISGIVTDARKAGFNTLIFQVRHSGYAYYASSLDPPAEIIAVPDDPTTVSWDPLAEAIEQAHAAGMSIYAWVEALPVMEEEAALREVNQVYELFFVRFGDEWLQRGQKAYSGDGSSYQYAAPWQEQVREYVAAVARDIASRYDVDGLHLTHLEYLNGVMEESSVPYRVHAEIAGDVDYEFWLTGELDTLVERVATEVATVRPVLPLSVGVWPVYEDVWGWGEVTARHNLLQDSHRWLEKGWVDAVMPECFIVPEFLLPERVTAVVEDYTAASFGRPVVPIFAGDSRSFIAIARAIDRAREAGAAGVAVYSYESLAGMKYWDDLAAGPFRVPAQVPPMPWKPG